jgi:N-carbamoyl-L-amino-acid hydrolase
VKTKIDGPRLIQSIAEMAEIGALPAGGCRRIALSDADRDGRDLFVSWCSEIGAKTGFDAFGNVFAVLTGTDPELSAVFTGSHLDTQPNGGRYDGIYGVLAGLEVLRTCAAHNIRPKRTLVVVNWTNEEGVSFSPGLTGSKGFAGQIAPLDLQNLLNQDGQSYAAELARIGYAGNYRPPPLHAYVEAHIEQGPILENRQSQIGLVTGVQGVRWFNVEIVGADRHAGTTPMDSRSDAAMCMAAIMVGARKALGHLDGDIRFTVGRVAVEPGSVNTVPGKANFSIDLRHPSTETLDDAEAAIIDLCHRTASAENCSAHIQRIFNLPPVVFDKVLVDVIKQASVLSGFDPLPMVSGAMHDACSIASIAPTAMIFIPCREGISHNEEEDVADDDVVAGAQVLLETMLMLAKR